MNESNRHQIIAEALREAMDSEIVNRKPHRRPPPP